MIKAVLDTNVFVSGLHPGASSPPAAIMQAWRQNKFILVTSSSILAELKQVLLRPGIQRFLHFMPDNVAAVIKTIRERAYITADTYRVEGTRKDPKDNMFLAAALEGETDYLVTGDEKHVLPLKQYHGVAIVNPALFLAALEKSDEEVAR